jgi:aldehyde dehydrogenase (NAD+)
LEHIFVAGKLRDAHSTNRVTVINPATTELVGSAVDGDATDVDAAVRAARTAFDEEEWRWLKASQRARFLLRVAEILEARSEQTARLVTLENGTPITQSVRTNGRGAAAGCRAAAALAETVSFEEARPGTGPSAAVVRREPIGVVGIIAPWNVPQPLLASPMAQALLAGNTVVAKPAAQTSLDAFVLSDAIREAGLPDGVVNIVTGDRQTGRALVEHPEVDKISFTGSTAAGRWIAATCGAALRPVTLELGGKSAAVLLDDADLGAFVDQLFDICLPNTGQVCFASTRIVAPKSRYEEIVDALASAMAAAPLGDPLAPDTVLGPLVTSDQRDRVEGYIATGQNEGAVLVTGGRRPVAQRQGWYVEPALFRDVRPEMRIAQEEIFGPVLAVIPYDGEDVAVQIANDSQYGLAGTVFSAEPTRAWDIARRMRTGSVGINGFMPTRTAPFGGVKASGQGRIGGPEGLAAYQELKSIFETVAG